MPTPPSDSQIIVTSAASLAAIVDAAVDRAVRRTIADMLVQRKGPDGWLTAREAMRVFGRSRTTLFRWRKDGLIASRKIGGSVYFARPDSPGQVDGQNLTNSR